MKPHLYNNTPFGIARVNEKAWGLNRGVKDIDSFKHPHSLRETRKAPLIRSNTCHLTGNTTEPTAWDKAID